MKKAFCFAGQGSQYSGMGRELYGYSKAVRNIFECCEDITGLSFKKTGFEFDQQLLSKTSFSQPLIFTVSLAALTAAKENGITPDCVAGHSLGECAALVAAGCMDTETGFKVVARRSAAMQKAADRSSGEMYAVIGKPAELIEQTVSELPNVWAVNFNAPTQTVIAGEKGFVSKAAERLEQAGARVVKLAVAAAFHTPHMLEASREMKENISSFEYSAPRIPFYSNLTGDTTAELADIPEYLAKQMVSPVRWVDIVGNIIRDGTDSFIELGPGRVLSGLIKKIDKKANTANIEDTDSLNKTLEIHAE